MSATQLLEVLLDLRHPHCYLALVPALALGGQHGLAIDFLPLNVAPLRAPTTPGESDDRGILHRRRRAQALAREIHVYGRAQGLTLRELYRDPQTDAFVLGWLWLRERDPAQLPDYLLGCFRDYWSLTYDPSLVEQTSSRIAANPSERRSFEAWCLGEGPAHAQRIAAELQDRGLSAVPGYVIEGEVFSGRQHLPMIAWILGGRRGPGPI